ncbi:MAG TPA: branched-chain amino acid ABC transporter permease [Acetobacteraceae bacterium]|jgi:branched-chain amino acid transport system permease protein|nr:branched-chain amino acid ABC transporter permease [Acetobacteraceae bacterium]
MEYAYTILMLMALSVILASSFNFVIGYGGLISIAHPVFYAIGAYASALLARDAGWPVLLAIPAGAGTALVASVLVALPALRVSGDYLLIASIGFQLGVLEAIKNVTWTGGAGGLTNIPALLGRGTGHAVYVALAVLVAAGTVLLLRWITRSPYGRAMSALRDDETAFAALGRNAMLMKLGVFALGAGLAGVAGGLYAHYFRFLAPDQFDILQSAALLTMVVVGGMRSVWGPVVGAVVLQVLPQAITFLNLPPSVLGPLQGLLFTGLVLVFMFVRPAGLIAAGDLWRGGSFAASAGDDRVGRA